MDASDDRAESRYKRRIGITLALITILGAWIAVMQADAATNESTTTREATRQAVEAQSADVLAKGVKLGRDNASAEIASMGSLAVFADPITLGESLGIEVDPGRAAERRERADAQVSAALDGSGPGLGALEQRANALSLEQAVTVQARITWNAKASQYETVLTVLAIAVFLVGFTLVIGRRLRPPVAVPGLLLAIFCAGWAAVIWSHEVPEVPSKAIEATARGEAALDHGRAGDAGASFTEALRSDPDYVPALRGRAVATLVAANPDLLRTLAVTDRSPRIVSSAMDDLLAAIDAGGDDDPRTMAVAALVATLGGRYERAEALLDDAIELNEGAVELYLAHAAVDIALDRPGAAESWLQRARQRFGDLDEDRIRALMAQYLSVLEVVGSDEPDRSDMVASFAQQAVANATEAAVGRTLDPDSTGDIGFEVIEAHFADDTTTLRFDLTGIDDDTAVALVGYERPAPGADFVQPRELFYAGTAAGRGDGVRLDTPRSCAPVEYRFDLYVEGELTDTATAPGVTPTC